MATKRFVRLHEGVRRVDQTKYHGLHYEGEFHKSFFLTPAQYRTVIALQKEAEEVLKNLPPREKPKKEK